jgi:hypothetical protein
MNSNQNLHVVGFKSEVRSRKSFGISESSGIIPDSQYCSYAFRLIFTHTTYRARAAAANLFTEEFHFDHNALKITMQMRIC